KSKSLHQLIYYLGVARKVVGFRSYSVNLNPEVDPDEPMLLALETLYNYSGDATQYKTFGQISPWPNPKNEIKTQLANVDIEIQKVVAGLILNLIDSHRWWCTMKAAQAVDDAAYQLDTLLKRREINLKSQRFNYITPLGRIIIGGGEKDSYNFPDIFILVELGGDDVYRGSVGAGSGVNIPISVAIDMDGDDVYENNSVLSPSQGSGMLGTGILYDMMGNDRYTSLTLSQGAGFFGVGVLFDGEGKDSYKLETSGQGAGYFGMGFSFDVKGNDSYYIYGEGQGFGGVSGIGVLANFEGDDEYTAEPSSKVVNRGDYHSQFKINVNNAQGVGSGRRGDGSDGHSWAGGLGAIIDIKGNDSYESGNWSLGTGYWFGTGIAFDGSGDDKYRSVYFTQASGAHYCIGALIDEGGDDTHILYETAGAGLAFGWDYTNALFVDKGGNDSYEARIISFGLAQIRSNAFFFDLGGDDIYKFGKGAEGMGAATFRKDYKVPNPFAPYYTYSNSVGIFIDISGTDKYLQWNYKNDRVEESRKFQNNIMWLNPPEGSENYGYNNFGIGIDSEKGTIPELHFFEKER
ncbi:MAG: hypothetical protein ACE5QV_08670, partial [Fidelibacterota bacterium]